jgi:hypothetical protein
MCETAIETIDLGMDLAITREKDLCRQLAEIQSKLSSNDPFSGI